MASDKSPAVDLSGMEDVTDWFKTRKNSMIGAVLFVLLVVAGWKFIQRQVAETAVKPWRAVFADAQPWAATPEQLASIATSGDVKNTPAEAFSNYWAALREFEAKSTSVAIQKLGELQAKEPNHPLCKLALPDPDNPAENKPVVARMLADMQRLEQWGKTYPVPAANPPPKPQFTVTLVTERGPVVLALYNDLAPKSCDAFMKSAPLLKDQFISRSAQDSWIELGQDAAGSNVEAKDVGDGFPPLEDNRLSHFPGTVAFRQPPFSKAPFFADLRITLKTDFAEDGHSTVFAQVAQGLEVLTGIAKEERKAGAPTILKTPVKITDVQVQKFDASTLPPPADK